MLSPIAIDRISPPSFEDFQHNYLKANRPIVITGLVNQWPALKNWDFEYFSKNFGDVKAGAFSLIGGECDLNTERGSKLESVSVAESISSITEGRLDNGWAIATPVSIFPTKFQKDYYPPPYCADGKFLRSMTFLGPKGTITSLHHDLPENLYVMVKGKKRIMLFAPSSPVYPNSPFSKLPNHSKIDAEAPDYERFPRVKNAQPYYVDLVAGETLFIPSLWWHHLRNLEPSIAVNFWWAQGWKLPIAWAAATYKRLRAI
ncbi:unnamed protein product [Sphagnum balticum]